jgi:molybdopterin synthase catalytic subunit
MPAEVTAVGDENFAVMEWITELRQTTKGAQVVFCGRLKRFPPHV